MQMQVGMSKCRIEQANYNPTKYVFIIFYDDWVIYERMGKEEEGKKSNMPSANHRHTGQRRRRVKQEKR